MKNFLLLSLLILVTAGCVPLVVGAAAGAGSITYLKGSFEKNLDKPVEKVYRAAVKSLNKQQMIITKESIKPHQSMIQFSTPNGDPGKIIIKSLTERASKITVRIGTFGDETLSRMILTSVEANL